MKLSRNRIRKIRKQQHQSVRRWKKQHKASARRSTFRQSRHRRSGSIITKNTPKVVNRTLKKYVSDDEIREIKQKYRKLRRDKRNKRRQVGGGEISPEMLQVAVTAAATAAVEIVLKQQQQFSKEQLLKNDSNNDVRGKSNDPTNTNSQTSSAESSFNSTVTSNTTSSNDNKNTSSSTKSNNPPFRLGPEIEGDVSIGMEERECNDVAKVYELVSFLIQKGLPYYVQIHLKSGDKAINKNDTNIFDLRRILYGKFTQNIKNISENKQKLYLKANDVVGIANSELYGNSDPGLFIYTGEKGQILKDSNDTSIKVRLLQDDPNAAPIPPLSDSKRLYKITGKGPDAKPDSINTMAVLTKLDRDNKIDLSEFRLQIAPMTQEELKKDAQKVASGTNKDPEVKVVVDESNTYIVNLGIGCKVVSIQTLKKSLEKMRLSLENENDSSKQSAYDILRKLTSLLQNPEFAKSDGYDDFKEKVFGFSYKISGSERLYGFTQLQTFFDDKKGNIPPRVTKEFSKLMSLLGHGPGGSNGDCLRFDGVTPSIFELARIQTYEEDGKIVTKKTETLDNASNMGGFGKKLSKIGETGSSESKENDSEGQSPNSNTNSETNAETNAGGVNANAQTGTESQSPTKEGATAVSPVKADGKGEAATVPTNPNEDMAKLEEKERTKAEEYEKEVEHRKLAAEIAAAAAATAAAKVLSNIQ